MPITRSISKGEGRSPAPPTEPAPPAQPTSPQEQETTTTESTTITTTSATTATITDATTNTASGATEESSEAQNTRAQCRGPPATTAVPQPKPLGGGRSVPSRENKKLALLKAQEEMLRLKLEMAAIKIAQLEEDSEAEEDEQEATLKEQRTTQWVQETQQLALTITPHQAPSASALPRAVEAQQQPREQQEPANGYPRGYEDNIHRAPDAMFHKTCARETQQNFDYDKFATAMVVAARNNSYAPTPSTPRYQELPSFNGASTDWLPFKTAYEESANLLSEQENLARLRRCLKGAAKEAVQCLFVGATTTQEVMKLLTARFGRPDALAQVEIDKLRRLPKLSENTKEICIFASRIINSTATIRALGKKHYLYNAEIVRYVVEKLPPALRYDYYKFNEEQHEDAPDLEKLSSFMEKLMQRLGSFSPAEFIQDENRRETASKKPAARSYHTNAPPKKTTCPLCQGDNHHIALCRTFKEADVGQRWELAKANKLCFRCLNKRIFKHLCKSKKCGEEDCEHYHHPLLHQRKPQPPSVTVASTKGQRNDAVLLKIVPVEVEGPSGVCNTLALLDDGSTCSLVEEEIAKKVGAVGRTSPFYIEGVAGTRIHERESQQVTILLRGRGCTKSFPLTARTMKNLHLMPQEVTQDVVTTCPHLDDIAEDLQYAREAPRILIGQDNWNLLATHEMRQGGMKQPVASRTDLGWVIHGIEKTNTSHRVHHVRVEDKENEEMERLMKEHFSLESLCVEPRKHQTEEEKRAIETLAATTRRLPQGGFETGLLWRHDTFTPPPNYETAVKRLEHVERKLQRNDELKERYEEQIKRLLEKGYAELAPPVASEKKWYLPHFPVLNPQKPGKVRIVHDAAAKTQGVSLNDLLLPGPDLLQSLPGTLMRFRQGRVAVTADIQDMFMRVTVREEDRDMQRFIWRWDGPQSPIVELRMKSVIFGATSSPCTAIYVKNKNAEDFADTYPEAAKAVVENHYVDDYLASFANEEEAARISSQVDTIHKRANYHLQKWASNSTAVLESLSPEEKQDRKLHQLDDQKILGMVWEPAGDTLTFNLNEQRLPSEITNSSHVPTKREALRVAMSIFDPLGIATPITMRAKRILQDTWRSGISWDEHLQHAEAQEWRKWIALIKRLQDIKIPRWYGTQEDDVDLQLHTFVDASSSAVCAATYWRVSRRDGTTYVALIAAKGRVAPLKLTSIPRLELQAAVLGTRLAETAMKEHRVKPSSCHYWTDSRTVLTWIRKGPRDYKPFVAHRVAEIAEATKTKSWHWVPTKDNVADDATRETPRDFNAEHRWFRGPEFLYRSEDEWPREQEQHHEALEDDYDEERRVNINVAVISSTEQLKEVLPDITRFSNWTRLIRSTARVLQFIELLLQKGTRSYATYKKYKANPENDPLWQRNETRSQPRKVGPITTTSRRYFKPIEVDTLLHAERLWTQQAQRESFTADLVALKKGQRTCNSSRLSKLSIELDRNDIIRLKSRIAATEDITEDQRSPAVLDGNHRFARLYINKVHRELHHGGFAITTNEVRQRYWMLRLRNAVRSEIKACQQCKLQRATPPQPSTGNHPPSRLAHHQRAFTYTGLDYFGPLYVTVGRGRQKRYGVIFTCLTTRAVHIEVASDLTTDSAIMALRRFIARRGCPTELWSDQGTNLRGADLEMKKAVNEALQEDVAARYIKWRYIPPSAPFMGGAWERLVRSIKTALYAVLQERAPKEEVLATLLVEAEHTLNSRPLTHVSTSPEDEDALTPNHLLLGGSSRVPLPGAFTEADADCRRLWRTSQRLADMFWARWLKEYLPELQHRREPRATNGVLQEGDLVFIADGLLPRNSWPRGVVVATFPGPDGEVRAADVRTNKGVLRRPTKKLVIIGTSREQENSSSTAAAGEYVQDIRIK